MPGAERPALEAVLSAQGWPYASTPPRGAGDPGRFHALFGRDALICALQVLPERPDVARATLRIHASLQGREDDPDTLEEPGRIVHEWRDEPPPALVERGWPAADGPFSYYATADATAWFLVLLAALGDRALARELDGAWRAAAGWLERALERGGGFVRHGPGRRRGGLTQHGWRDAVDPRSARDRGGGIVHPDGRTPASPLADADVQAAAHAGLRAAAALSGQARWAEAAAALQERVGAAFDPGTMAIEPDGTRVEGAGSQLGWLLWADALPAGAPREAAAARLCEPDLLTPYGLRTLSADARHFDAHAYHRGSIWPFDSWLGWGGLRAAGREAEAERVRTGVLTALDDLGEAPELYAVTRDGALQRVALSNFVQAWTIGARSALEAEWDGRVTVGTSARR